MKKIRNSWTVVFGRTALAATLVSSVVFGSTCATRSTMPPPPAQVNDSNEWPMHGRSYDNTRYSPLKDINANNVKNLKVAYAYSLGTLGPQESSPIVIGNTLYVTSAFGPRFVHALDAATGKRKWVQAFDLPDDFLQYTCCGPVNRGVAYANGKIFVGRLDGKLSALDAKTGREIWTTTVVDYKQGSSITAPPLIVKNTVVTGFGGGEFGARGYLSAYDLETGKQVWKTWTIPGPGEPGNDSWKGDSWKTGGGTAWMRGSYDPDQNIIYWGTGNPGPWNSGVRGPGSSNYGKYTNLYSDSTLALHGDSGMMLWYLQSTPHDAWDYDGTNVAVLADLNIGGKKVPVYMKADRNGFFYVVNRKTGKLISADAFVHVTWAKGVDLATGRPIEISGKRATLNYRAMDVCPNILGGKNWMPMSYNPDTGLVYIPANNLCMDAQDTEVNYSRGFIYLGREFTTHTGPGGFGGELLAWDPVKRKPAWSIKQKHGLNGGTMTTVGNLVFQGDLTGQFNAVNATTGEVLWSFNVGSGVQSGPVTYKVGDKQYVAVTVGRPEALLGFFGEPGARIVAETSEAGMLFVFSL